MEDLLSSRQTLKTHFDDFDSKLLAEMNLMRCIQSHDQDKKYMRELGGHIDDLKKKIELVAVGVMGTNGEKVIVRVKERVNLVVKEQVELLGSESLYNKLKDFSKFEPWFAEEQKKLYKWRRHFFKERFGKKGTMWDMFEDEGDEEVTVPVLLTEYFDFISSLAMVVSEDMVVNLPPMFFSEGKYQDIDSRFGDFVDCGDMPDIDLEEEFWYQHLCTDTAVEDFSLGAHLICDQYKVSPPTLKELGIKKVLELGLSQDTLPRTVRNTIEQPGRSGIPGLYMVRHVYKDNKSKNCDNIDMEASLEASSSPPGHISERGKTLFKNYMRRFILNTEESLGHTWDRLNVILQRFADRIHNNPLPPVDGHQ